MPVCCCKILANTFPEQAVGSSGADGFSKTFPGVPNEFRVSGCGIESWQGLSQKNLEGLKDDSARAVTESSLLSQDHGNLWNNSESSLYLVIPVFEP